MKNQITTVRKGPVDSTHSPNAQWQTLPLEAVSLLDGFWSAWQNQNRGVSLKHGYQMLEKSGAFHNLRLAAGWTTGSFMGRNFYDEDVYKWLEALGWELGNRWDPELQAMADEVINLIAAAQMPDGYIDSYYQVVEPKMRWVDMDHGHEDYCAGHLIQAAIAFWRAVGDAQLLDIACKLADLMCTLFGPGIRSWAPGHPEVEMALVELYRTTGERRYLELAQFFIDERGQKRMRGWGPYGPEYHQDQVPVREASEAAGHAVRQLYLTTGVTDLYLETGEQALLEAMNRLWQDIFESKLFVTGGVGSRYDGESFGEPYELPSDQCYCETCAAIGSLMWNWRMLLLSGDGRYADEMERALYNSILSSPSLDGRHYFYVNPLQVRGSRYVRLSTNPSEGAEISGRPEWHEVACCPPNVMRLFASLPHYFVTQSQKGVQVHQYAPARIEIDLISGGQAALKMETDYPWQGAVRLVVVESTQSWELRLRKPGWCYSPVLAVNGKVVKDPQFQNGYYTLEREWRAGDVVELDFPMPAVLIEPNPRVDAIRQSLAIQRGPLVYCLESQDQEAGLNLLDIEIDEKTTMQAAWDEQLLGGVMVVEAGGSVADPQGWGGELYKLLGQPGRQARRPLRLKAIPYYAWGNRGLESMRVWLPRSEK